MKIINKLSFLFLFLFLLSCSDGQSQKEYVKLNATEFSNQIESKNNIQLVDVRTPQEYSKGHLENSLNINWNDTGFESQISKMDKNKPIYVYCLSGGRSAQAVSKMQSLGFKEIYELDGGIMKWRAANLKETMEKTVVSSGMSKKQYDDLLNSDKLVLIDFYAEWCAPCKKMKPYLDEISKDLSDKVEIIRIDADENKELCKELKIDALPVLFLYKKNQLKWSNVGYISKQDVLKELE
jgi:thioredoxin 1